MEFSVAGFDWDEGNWPKCGKHGVSKTEVEHVLRSVPMVLPDRYPQDAERALMLWEEIEMAATYSLFFLRNKEGKQLIRPISARYMHRREIRSYEQQKGKEA